jgi:RHS repeat-associated protein
VKLVDGTVTEKYLWADDNITLLAVYDGNNNLKTRFEYAEDLRPVSMVKDGGTYYLSYDQASSLRAVLDAQGNIVKQIEYDSFGNIINDTNRAFEIPLGFAGGFHDRDTGLVRFGARDYDPDTGRWTAKDPISFNGGDTDLYGYCFMDPVNLVDVNGNNAQAQTAQDLLKVLFPALITLELAGAALLAKVSALIIAIAPYLIVVVAVVAVLVVAYYLNSKAKIKGKSKTKGADKTKGNSKNKNDTGSLSDANPKDLRKLPDNKVEELGGEGYTQGAKKDAGKSKANLYWNPKTGDVYTKPNASNVYQWIDKIPVK